MTIQFGTKLCGRYTIRAKIGEGGFGSVYKANDDALNRVVALKLLKVNLLQDDDLKRIKREAQLLGQLSHPNIVRVYSVELLDDDTPMIVLEYLEGKSLAAVINREGVDYETCSSVFNQICEGLSYAHENGIVHRDLSPFNIFLIEDDKKITAKIIDFGLSKMLKPRELHDSDPTTITLTATGMLVGNPLYMSPEVCRGEKAEPVSDIYALGCVLYEMLSGKPLFEEANPVSSLYMHQHVYPPKPTTNWNAADKEELYQNIARICIQKEKQNRPQTVHQLIECLQDSEKLAACLKNASEWGNTVEKNQKSKQLIMLALSMVALAVLIGSFAAIKYADSAHEAQMQLKPVAAKHLRAKSPMARLIKVHDELTFPQEPAKYKELLVELDEIMNSEKLIPPLMYTACLYKANVLEALKAPLLQQKAAYESCLPYSRLQGQNTLETAAILFRIAFLEQVKPESYQKLRTAIAVYQTTDHKPPLSLEMKKELVLAQNAVLASDICALLASMAQSQNKPDEELRWLKLGVQKSNPDPNWHWKAVSLEAECLRRQHHAKEADALLKKLLDDLSENSLENANSKFLQQSADQNIWSLNQLGDFCKAYGLLDYAKSSYARALELIDKTGLCERIKGSVEKKLAALKAEAP